MLILWLHLAHSPHMSVYETVPKTIKFKVTNHGEKKWGITSMFTLYSWPTCHMALPHVVRRQFHVSSSIAKIVIHVKINLHTQNKDKML